MVEFPAADARPVLVLDTASPTVSLALAAGGELLAERHLDLRQTSERLLLAVEEALTESGLELAELAGIAALQGPGSFTGLRIGLATVLGWHQALGLPATAFPTLPVLAAAAWPVLAARGACAGTEVLAAVDAIRGDWSVQHFRLDPLSEDATAGDGSLARAEPRADSELLAADALRERLATTRLVPVGFGLDSLFADGSAPEPVVPPPLAATAARLASLEPALLGIASWDPGRLVRPIYYRPPAVTKPKSR